MPKRRDLLARLKPVRPGPDALRIAQDRLKEKNFLRGIGIATDALIAAVESAADLARAVAAIGRAAMLKTVRLGYDGKGQLTIETGTDLGASPGAAWRRGRRSSRASSISPARFR